ncbi:FAD-binding oxidoreductase [Agromyces ramosus]|uniref:FAD/FMN-containing dehydrogenase n=1 Tax=Agromyces ramosus TaxID=33879 RepID=A0ABU0R5E4_9MICO|nr:FAD-binding oxidoreductase [Agromyces ramosus]MDQ0893294.1 FAD/FMN-containing dehydrogenase [Agromyces ramosus]
MSDSAPRPALDALADRLGERVTRPGHPLWDAMRSPWNLAIDQRPAAVAVPADVDELRAVLVAARSDGLGIAVQPSGHGASGSLEGAVLVRTSAFDEIEIDTAARIARVGAGVRWGLVLEALAGSGLVPLAGSSPVVNATAFTIGGGHSWFSRTHGLGSGALRAVQLLTADGRHRWIRDADDPELMWALRGAGGAFGVVTAIEIELYPAPELVGGRLVFAPTDAAAVFRAVIAAGRSAPESLALHAGAMRIPDVPAAPPELRGTTIVSVELVELGASAEARDAIDAIRAAGTVHVDTVGRFEVELLGTIAEEPTDPSPGYGWSVFADLDDDVVTRLVEAWEEPEGRAVMAISLRLLGGALAGAPARPSIAGAIRQNAVVSGHAIGWPELADAVRGGFAHLREALGPAASDRTLCTFAAPGVGYSGAYAQADVARAARVKATVDPEARFVGNREFR